MTTRTVLLRCPNCNERLTGLPIDRVFFCTSCRIGVDFYQHVTDTIQVHYLKVDVSDEGPYIYLPAWRYKLSVSISSDDKQAQQFAVDAAPENLWVFGCIFKKQSLYGDPNIELTRLNPSVDLTGTPNPLAGCQLRGKHADELVIPVTGAVIDMAQDITNLNIGIEVKSRQLIALPLKKDSKYLRLPQTSLTISLAGLQMQSWLEGLENGEYYP